MVANSRLVEKQPQSDMERCSTRNHENATADPSAAPQDDSAKGDDASYYRVEAMGDYRVEAMGDYRVEAMGDYRVEAMGEFSGQVVRLRSPRHPNDKDPSLGIPVRRPLLRMTSSFDDSLFWGTSFSQGTSNNLCSMEVSR